MSDPDVRYLGDAGEISAVYRPAHREPELTIGSGTTLRYLATGAFTNGQFGLYRWEVGPHTAGPRPHFHTTMSESFFILSGTVRLFNGQCWMEGTTGDFFYVPEGGVHTFKNESGEPASMLLLFVPGGPREEYFEALAEIAGGRQFSHEEWTDFCLRHDNYFLP